MGATRLSARRMAVLWTFREPSLCRHGRRELMRNAVLDFTPIIPATACNQRTYVETYSKYSKYNPIERCWGILEEHWNGTLLETVDTVLHWAHTMTWKAVRPVVQLLDKVYANGIRVAKKAFRKIEERLERHASLPK